LESVKSWWTSVGEYLHPRVVGVFFMGISSGFPLTLLLSSLGFWLIDEGVSKSTIGLLTLSLLPYFFKVSLGPGTGQFTSSLVAQAVRPPSFLAHSYPDWAWAFDHWFSDHVSR